MRTFVLAGLYARRRGWKYDEELVFISAALHDLALLEKYERADVTFEEAGAKFAQSFVEKGGFSPDRADRVWKSIAWHAGNVPDGADPDIALIQAGAGIDVLGGADFQAIHPQEIQAILAQFPRLAFKSAFKGLLAAHANRQPAHATWTAQFAQEPPPPLVLAFLNSPWPE
jgi:hypothetical protein